MTLPSEQRMAELLAPFYPQPSALLLQQLTTYLGLLARWNERTNLTSVRDPEDMVSRHFGESLFVASHIPEKSVSLLDLGSGAGFPGLPVQLALPTLQVTLAESQGKKASFLREVVRELGLPTEVWGARAESLAGTFDVVALRAVDRPTVAILAARKLVAPGGMLAHLTVADGIPGLQLVGSREEFIPLPRVSDVPRGTFAGRRP